MSLAAARRRVRADRQALLHRLEKASESRSRLDRELANVRPAWVVGAGLFSGFIVGGLPAKAIGGIIGAITAFSLRLMSTPLGPAAFGAIMARRAKGSSHGHRRVSSATDSS